MTSPAEAPSYDDVRSAFERIRAAEPTYWDVRHPLRRFELAAQAANIHRSCERLAAYRLAKQTPPLGYYDSELDNLYRAIELLLVEREQDHGDAPSCLAQGSERSEFFRARHGRSLKVTP